VDLAEVRELHRGSELQEKLSLGGDLKEGWVEDGARSCCAGCGERHWVCFAETDGGTVLQTSKVRTSVAAAVAAVDLPWKEREVWALGGGVQLNRMQQRVAG
jgi:hypothetical protein